ncbi:hypothetical protein QMP26_15095 [Enterocloster clostridioformis]
MARLTDRPMSAVKKLHREGICLSVHPIEETDGMSIFDIPLVMPASPDRQEISPDQRFHIRLVCPRKKLPDFFQRVRIRWKVGDDTLIPTPRQSETNEPECHGVYAVRPVVKEIKGNVFPNEFRFPGEGFVVLGQPSDQIQRHGKVKHTGAGKRETPSHPLGGDILGADKEEAALFYDMGKGVKGRLDQQSHTNKIFPGSFFYY